MSSIHIGCFTTPWGEMLLGSYEQQLCLCDWRGRAKRQAVDARLMKGLGASYVEQEDDLLNRARQQLNEYFAGQRRTFDLPLMLVGTPFQKQVWSALQQIPYGTTASYRQLAELLGEPKAVRAVAGANGANALSIFVPCHRVIGSDGRLTGYAGGLAAKTALLSLETEIVN
ncbi:cysteine methyltransferase [Marinobacter fuscus]|uniref:Methylated-DNA--protein-cysteine methyltransferase n=1 Tax=Marinobacter fuscus TaxID=2109942 RepID=A0A2T1KQ48_9GAMM|nr:methylated-DNA--[protein]-cysteine S-methyltransferase [Marinobacter fuscus]PSF11793.1 cysteine methyltransferase [Marinobacter fuscus]